MSNYLKFNTAWLTVVVSALTTAASVVWIASSKAKDIETQAADIHALKAADRSTQALLQRLDERTVLILETLRRQ